ncbi:MAG: DUF1838 family protein [Candidatus Cloacimonetes bacterium]|nr:DUF1838 family protein [Candidatus Cloacimonadota bacterium]HPN40904.1 DUF1838 family protein [Candidatus Cloacimonadota bacterium]
MRSPVLTILSLLLLCGSVFAIDLSSPAAYFDTFLKTRADLSGKETVFHWTGKVYGMVPGERRTELFAFEGFSVARLEKAETGYLLLTREAAFFKDPRTGEILETWRNPYLKNAETQVVHIWNDPVNQDFGFSAEEMPLISKFLPSEDLGSELVFYMDLFPLYESPLPRKEYSQFSQSDIYQAAEFFQFYVPKSAIADSSLTSLPCNISWTRISPWMPFMRMGDRKGNLVFACRGSKLEGGFEALPAQIRNYVMEKAPRFATAPDEYSEPNETSWTYFKKLMDAGVIKP